MSAVLRTLRVALAFAAAACVVALAASACRVYEPANRPLDRCRHSCEKKASRQCSEAACERGCEMILDRIIERESENVLACVAASPRKCSDVVFADCAARVGAHADGGPPGPPPPVEED